MANAISNVQLINLTKVSPGFYSGNIQATVTLDPGCSVTMITGSILGTSVSANLMPIGGNVYQSAPVHFSGSAGSAVTVTVNCSITAVLTASMPTTLP